MCPVLALLPFIVCALIAYGVNYFVRKGKIAPVSKYVLITGCDRGFGQTLARRLSLDGFHVFACCLDDGSEGANELKSLPRVTVQKMDVTKDDDVKHVTEFVTQIVGERGLWAVVNNAGIAVFAETEWCSMEAYQRLISVNLLGTIRVSRAFLPLVRRAQGRVVNMSSLAGRCALPGFTAYSASKFGIIGFSDSLRREMRKWNVKVITIEPKLYRTAIADIEFHTSTNEKMWQSTSEVVRQDFGLQYLHVFMDGMLKGLRISSRKTYQVIDDLVHAITAKYPYTRYVPNTKVAIMSDSFIIQPNIVQDGFLEYMMGIKSPPAMLAENKSV